MSQGKCTSITWLMLITEHLNFCVAIFLGLLLPLNLYYIKCLQDWKWSILHQYGIYLQKTQLSYLLEAIQNQPVNFIVAAYSRTASISTIKTCLDRTCQQENLPIYFTYIMNWNIIRFYCLLVPDWEWITTSRYRCQLANQSLLFLSKAASEYIHIYPLASIL